MTVEVEAVRQAERQQKLGTVYLSAMIRVLSVATFHRLDNAAIHNVIAGLLNAAAPIIEEHGRVELQTIGEHVFLNREPIRLRGDAFEHAMRLRRIFKRMGLNELSMTGSVTAEDLKAFLVRFQTFYTSADPRGFVHEKFDRIAVRMIVATTASEQIVQIGSAQNALRSYLGVVGHVSEAMAAFGGGRAPRIERVRRAVQQLCDAAGDHEGAVAAFTRYEGLRGDGAGHATATAALAVLMARQLALPRRAVAQIAMAAALHATRPDHHLGCGADLDAVSAAQARRQGQVKTAIDLTRGVLSADTLQWLVGAGELNEATTPGAHVRLSALARFVAVPCAYHLLTSPPPGQLALSPDLAVAAILDGAGSRFDPVVARLFAAVVGLYPVGTTVRLSNGATGIVVSMPADPAYADRPVIKVTRAGAGVAADALLDLSRVPDVRITGAVPVEDEVDNPIHFLLA
jgi:HD-GYP domain-containing protein (c-di-GMP phosphodiesterase class II)